MRFGAPKNHPPFSKTQRYVASHARIVQGSYLHPSLRYCRGVVDGRMRSHVAVRSSRFRTHESSTRPWRNRSNQDSAWTTTSHVQLEPAARHHIAYEQLIWWTWALEATAILARASRLLADRLEQASLFSCHQQHITAKSMYNKSDSANEQQTSVLRACGLYTCSSHVEIVSIGRLMLMSHCARESVRPGSYIQYR